MITAQSAAAISDRIRRLPLYREARETVVRVAVRVCRRGDLRELGGITAVVQRQIDRLPPECHANHGSRVWPRSVAAELRAQAEDLRADVQVILARLEAAQQAEIPGRHLLTWVPPGHVRRYLSGQLALAGYDMERDWHHTASVALFLDSRKLLTVDAYPAPLRAWALGQLRLAGCGLP